MSKDTLFEIQPPARTRKAVTGTRFVCPHCWSTVTVYIPAEATCARCNRPMQRMELEDGAPAAAPEAASPKPA